MVNGQAGKGDRYRPSNRKAWNKAWLRVFGKECTKCYGLGKIPEGFGKRVCNVCKGIGKVE